MKKFFKNFISANSQMTTSSKAMFLILTIIFLSTKWNSQILSISSLITILILIISIVCHEVAHGFTAYINGDDTAKLMGRLTLNPIKHMDPLGMLLPIFLTLMGSSFVIGWAKPVPIDYSKLKKGEFSVFLVSIAGAMANFTLALLGVLLLRFVPNSLLQSQFILPTTIIYLININLALGIFNLLPIPPLDGSKILWSIGGNKLKNIIYALEPHGFLIIIILSYTGILWMVIDPIFTFFLKIASIIIMWGR